MRGRVDSRWYNEAMSINALAITTATSAIGSADTSISVEDTSRFESESTPFYISVSPAGETATPDNTEIMQVRNVSSGTLAVERGQLNTAPQEFDAGVYVYRGIYAKDLVAPRQLPIGSYNTTASWTTLWDDFVLDHPLGSNSNAVFEYDPDFDIYQDVTGLPVYRASRIVLTSSLVRITGEDANGNVVKYFADLTADTFAWVEDNGYYVAEYDTTNSTSSKAIFKVSTGDKSNKLGDRFVLKFSRVMPLSSSAIIYINLNGEELMAVTFTADGAPNSQPSGMTYVGAIRQYEFSKIDVPSVDIHGQVTHTYMLQCLNAFTAVSS